MSTEQLSEPGANPENRRDEDAATIAKRMQDNLELEEQESQGEPKAINKGKGRAMQKKQKKKADEDEDEDEDDEDEDIAMLDAEMNPDRQEPEDEVADDEEYGKSQKKKAPRTKKGRTKTSGKKAAVVLKRPTEVGLPKWEQQQAEFRKELDAATLFYAPTLLVEGKSEEFHLIFRRYNLRQPEEGGVLSLMKSLDEQVREWWSEDAVICLVVRPEQISNADALAEKQKTPLADYTQYENIEWSPAHAEEERLALGGLHRARALERLRKKYDQRVERATRRATRVQNQKKRDPAAEADALNELAVAERDSQTLNWWLFRVLDQSKVSIELAQWLSANTTRKQVVAQDSEQMVSRVREAMGEGRGVFLSREMGSPEWMTAIKKNCSKGTNLNGGPGQVGKAVLVPPWLRMVIWLLPWSYYHTSDVTNPKIWVSSYMSGVPSVWLHFIEQWALQLTYMSSMEPLDSHFRPVQIIVAYRKWYKCAKRLVEAQMLRSKVNASAGAKNGNSDDEETPEDNPIDPDTRVPGATVLLTDDQLTRLKKMAAKCRESDIIQGVSDTYSAEEMEEPDVDTDAYNEEIMVELDRHFNTMMRPVLDDFMCPDSLEWKAAWWKMTDFSYQYLLAQWKKLGYTEPEMDILEARWLCQTYVRERTYSPYMTDSAAAALYTSLLGVKEGLNWFAFMIEPLSFTLARAKYDPNNVDPLHIAMQTLTETGQIASKEDASDVFFEFILHNRKSHFVPLTALVMNNMGGPLQAFLSADRSTLLKTMTTDLAQFKSSDVGKFLLNSSGDIFALQTDTLKGYLNSLQLAYKAAAASKRAGTSKTPA
ncbi:hypothetical protein EUX98_g8443, partial [Antrodiella citrinella]